MLAPLAFLLGLALIVAAVFGLAGPWWAALAAGLACVLVAVLVERGTGTAAVAGAQTRARAAR